MPKTLTEEDNYSALERVKSHTQNVKFLFILRSAHLVTTVYQRALLLSSAWEWGWRRCEVFHLDLLQLLTLQQHLGQDEDQEGEDEVQEHGMQHCPSAASIPAVWPFHCNV